MSVSGSEQINITRLPHGEGLPLPSYETKGSAGMDLRAALPQEDKMVLSPGQRALVDTGIKIALPSGLEGQIRPRSGLAHDHGITVLNSPGTIDSDYRGEIKVLLANHGDSAFSVTHGDRVAQLVIAPYVKASWNEVNMLRDTNRGEGGFGSTGGLSSTDAS